MQEGCDQIAEIAQNPDAVRHLNNWADENVLNKNYYFAYGMLGSIHATSVDGKMTYLPLPDESVTGMRNIYYRFSLDKIGDDHKATVTDENISKLIFGQGRNSVILMKNGQVLTSHRGLTEASGHLLKINESVYAYCADAQF